MTPEKNNQEKADSLKKKLEQIGALAQLMQHTIASSDGYLYADSLTTAAEMVFDISGHCVADVEAGL